MKSYYGQYPEIYSKGNTRYTYFADDGEKIALVAGEDGVTDAWIEVLRAEHRKEYNMLRRGQKRRGENDEGLDIRLYCLEQCMELAFDGAADLVDESADIEENYFAAIERRERCEVIRLAWASLTDAQQELVTQVYIKKIPITQVAKEQGVTHPAIIDRLKRIKNIFEKKSQIAPYI